jgi:hypothetical protein
VRPIALEVLLLQQSKKWELPLYEDNILRGSHQFVITGINVCLFLACVLSTIYRLFVNFVSVNKGKASSGVYSTINYIFRQAFPIFIALVGVVSRDPLINLAAPLLLSVRKFICTAYVKAPVSCYLSNWRLFLPLVLSRLCSNDVCGCATINVDGKLSKTFASTSGSNTKSLFNHPALFLDNIFLPYCYFSIFSKFHY